MSAKVNGKDWGWLQATANKAAADYLRGRVTTDSATLKKLDPEIRARAFAVAGVRDMDVLKNIQAMIAKLPEGANWNDVRENIAADISEQWGGVPENGDPAKYVAAVERRAELVLRQSAFQAYAVARYTDQQEVKAAFPFLMYLSVGDQNVRDEHAELDGKILPVDDPFWLTHYPPWDFGCRCLVESISAEDAAELGVWEDKDKWEKNTPTRADKDYAFRPDTLDIPLEKIAEDRSEEDLGLFRGAMSRHTVTLPDGEELTVLDWISGKRRTA